MFCSYPRIIYLFCLLIFSLSCTKPQTKPCQRIDAFGLTNVSDCQADETHYEAMGFLDRAIEQDAFFSILLIGDQIVSDDFLPKEKRLAALLEQKLMLVTSKKLRVINGGMRDATSTFYLRNYQGLSQKFFPNLIIYLLNGSTQVGRDYFFVNKQFDFCPISKILLLQSPWMMSLILKETGNSVKSLQKAVSLMEGHEILFIWAGEGINSESVLNQISGCDFFKGLIVKKNLSQSEIQKYSQSQGLNILFDSSITKAVTIKNKNEVNHNLSEALIPLVMKHINKNKYD